MDHEGDNPLERIEFRDGDDGLSTGKNTAVVPSSCSIYVEAARV
jgi:hypothetical protein